MPRNYDRNTRSRGFIGIIKKQAVKFCIETALHGYKYMAHSERTKAERIVWGVTVFTALSCAIILMHTAWEYNSSRATLTVIESTHRGIWNYPFPAVTICNLNRISYSRVNQFVDQIYRNCQPDCTLYRYPLEGSQGVLNTLDKNGFFDLVSTQYRRAIYYDWRNLFASFGGLLGLFAGFSLMSGFELIYFFIVRLITDTIRNRMN